MKTTGNVVTTTALIALALSVPVSCSSVRCEDRVPTVMPTGRVQPDRIARILSTDRVVDIIRTLGPPAGLGSHFGQLSFGSGVYWYTTDNRVFEVTYVEFCGLPTHRDFAKGLDLETGTWIDMRVSGNPPDIKYLRPE